MRLCARLLLLCLLLGLLAGCGAATRAADAPTRAADPSPVPTGTPATRPSPTAQAARPTPTTPPMNPLTYTVEYGDTATDPSADAGDGAVRFYESTWTLPAYSLEPYQSAQTDPLYRWPYTRFDIERFRTDAPSPQPRTLRTLVLENEYLIVTILPELGGRVLQTEHKPSGTRLFYENDVLKPTAWGPAQQAGWLALGGLEWGLPVEEHGYAWGEAWGYIPLEFSEDRAAVTVFTPQDGRALTAAITIELAAGAAAFTIEPVLTNVSDQLVSFDYWHNAMLAPGDGQGISGRIHFVLPTDAMLVHSTEDARLPSTTAAEPISWPVYNGRDLSRLQTWREYAGLFEYPAAHGPFAAVYDTAQDAGAVRAFPAEIARGSKIFALGGSQPLDSALYTDDGSAYVELHAGLSPSFSQQVNLEAGESVSWRETWYSVHGLGDLDAANELAALRVQADRQGVRVAVYAVRALDAEVVLEGAAGELARAPVELLPGRPATVTWSDPKLGAQVDRVRIQTEQGPVIEIESAPQ